MIDVVFQLLIFFIVTLKQEDILAHLDVSRPAPDPNAKPEEQVDLLEILVYNEQQLGGEGYSTQGRKVTLAALDRQLTRLASYSTRYLRHHQVHGDSARQPGQAAGYLRQGRAEEPVRVQHVAAGIHRPGTFPV